MTRKKKKGVDKTAEMRYNEVEMSFLEGGERVGSEDFKTNLRERMLRNQYFQCDPEKDRPTYGAHQGTVFHATTLLHPRGMDEICIK